MLDSLVSLYFQNPSDFERPDSKKLYNEFIPFFSSNHTFSFRHNRKIEISSKIGGKFLESFLSNHPRIALSSISLAAHIAFAGYEILPFGTLFHVSINDLKGPSYRISELKSELVGSFIKVRGIIINSTKIKTMNIECKAECVQCGKEFVAIPSKNFCPSCKSSKYYIIDNNPIRKNYQHFVLKDLESDITLDCDLNGEIVGCIKLGEIVDLTGILYFHKKSQIDRNFILRLDVNYVHDLQTSKGGFVNSFLNINDGNRIQEIGGRRDVFPILVQSLHINLNPMIKASILLYLFSTPDDPIHILLSKSNDQIFHSIKKLIPFAIIYNDRSLEKLQTSVQKSKYISGIFVQANQSLLIINDIDRFKKAQIQFLEVNELGYEIVDPYHTIDTTFSSIVIADQKELNMSVKSIFTLKFEVDDEASQQSIITPRSQKQYSNDQWLDKALPLCDRLAFDPTLNPINSNDFMKYIIYVRQFVKPQWNEEAKNRLYEISRNSDDLRNLKNLAQCRAKIEMRSIVNNDDINEAQEILEWSRNPPLNSKKSNSRGNSKQSLIVNFITEFKRVANYKKDGIVEESEIKEIASMLNVTTKFLSFEHFMNALTTNNLILLSGPKKYRIGSSL